MSLKSVSSDSLAPRLGQVRVGIRPELEVSRHVFQGESSYVVLDPVTFASHQLSARDYRVFGALDDQRTLAEVFDGLVERQLLSRDQESGFYEFIVRLHQLGLLNLPVSDVKSLYQRFENKQAARRRGRITGLLFMRVPLIQPDAFLSRTARWVAPLFTRTAFWLWLAGLLMSLWVVGLRWNDFRDPVGTMLALQNLPVMWALLVGLKVVHEFGHAYACKHLGGQVPEMGAYFILFTPCAYMDASASWSFPNRWHRIMVALGGMYFESIVAMLSLLVWCLTEPSLTNSIAHYAVILSTAVTIAFNINPLMRFDGYFILSDLVNMPNLRQAATAELLGILKRRLFGVSVPPVFANLRKRMLLSVFGISSALYKVGIVLGISAIIAAKVPVAGLALAAVYLGQTCWMLLSQLVLYIAQSTEVARVRRRAIAVSCGAAVSLLAALALVPAVNSVNATGIVVRQDDRVVRAPGTGFLLAADVEVGQEVFLGQRICDLENPELEAAQAQAAAEVRFLQAAIHEHGNQREASAARQRLEQAELALARLVERRRMLQVRIPTAGAIVDARGLEMSGRYVREGEPLAKISSGAWVVDALAEEAVASSSMPRLGDRVRLRLEGDWGQTYQGTVVSTDSAGTRQIRDRALTHLAGGTIPVSNSMEADRPFFPIRIALEGPDSRIRHGMRVEVTFSGQRVPVGVHVYRRVLRFVNQLGTAG